MQRVVAAARRLVAQFPPLTLFECEWAGTHTPAISEWHTAAAPIVRRHTAAPLACLVCHKRRGKGKLRLEVEVLRPVEQMPSTSNLAEDRPRSGPAVTGPGEISCTWSLFWGREWLFMYGYADLFCYMESCGSIMVSTRNAPGRCCCVNWYVGVELPSVGIKQLQGIAPKHPTHAQTCAEFETSSATPVKPGKVNWSMHAQSKTYINPAHIPQSLGRMPILFLFV